MCDCAHIDSNNFPVAAMRTIEYRGDLGGRRIQVHQSQRECLFLLQSMLSMLYSTLDVCSNIILVRSRV